MKKLECEEDEVKFVQTKRNANYDLNTTKIEHTKMSMQEMIKKGQSQIKLNNTRMQSTSYSMQTTCQPSQIMMNAVINKRLRKNQFLKFPPHPTSIVSKRKKARNDNTSEMEAEAQVFDQDMEKVYEKDLQAFQNDKMAIQKILFLNKHAKRFLNIKFRQKFIEQGGLDILARWLMPIEHPELGAVEPSCTIRTCILNLLKDMDLCSREINKSSDLWHLIEKNRNLACFICQQYNYRRIQNETQVSKYS